MSEARSVRHRFFTDLMEDYKLNKEQSFLYLELKNEYEKAVADSIEAAETKTTGTNATKKKGKSVEKRKSFYEELSLNYHLFHEQRISKVEILTYIFEYLNAHDKYYKDQNGEVGHECLFPFLNKLLGIKPKELWKDKEHFNIKRTKKDVEQDIKNILQGLEASAKNKTYEMQNKIDDKISNKEIENLVESLKRIAIHIRVKTYLQDSGFPIQEFKAEGKNGSKKTELGKEELLENEAAVSPRKQDFTMQLFSRFCASDKGYSLQRKVLGEEKETRATSVDLQGRQIKNNYYYLKDNRRNEITTLYKALCKSGNDTVFIPLVIDLISGCLLAIVGKENYRYLYEEEAKRIKKEFGRWRERRYIDKSLKEYLDEQEKKVKLFENSYSCCCFDFLRFQPENFEMCYTDERMLIRSALQVGPYSLGMNFHEVEKLDYETMLERFKIYCTTGEENGDYDTFDPESAPRNVVCEMNDIMPGNVHPDFSCFFMEDNEEDGNARDFFESISVGEQRKLRIPQNLKNQVLTKE